MFYVMPGIPARRSYIYAFYTRSARHRLFRSSLILYFIIGLIFNIYTHSLARKTVVYKRLQMEVWHDFILSIAIRLLPTTGVLFHYYIHKIFNIYCNSLNIK